MRSVLSIPLAALAVTLALGSGCSRRRSTNATNDFGWRIPPLLVYVSDEASGNIAVVDPASAQVVTSIAVGKRPRGLKLSRDRKQLFVALSGSPTAGPGVDETKLPPADRSADGIAVVDLAARKVVRVLPGGQDPEALDLSPDGATLYVSNEETAELTALDLSSGTVRGKASVGKEPGGVTVRPNGKTVYVTSQQGNEVTAVDATTLAVIGHLPTGRRPRSIAFAKDGVTAFVSNELGGTLTVLDTGAQKPSAELKITEDSPMPSGVRPMGMVLSADGKLLYVSTGRGGSLAIVDVAQQKQVRSIDGIGDRPWGIGVSEDGALLYSANGTSTDMSIVNLATGNVDKRVHIGGLPWGLVVAR